MDFNYLDVFVLVILAISFFKGFSKGFVIVIASFIALILGVVGAIYFSDIVAGLLAEKTDISEQYLSITAFGLTFLAIIFGVHLIAKIVNQAVKMVALGPLNKVMGGVFSVLKSVVILSVVFYIFDFINHKIKIADEAFLEDSVSYVHIRNITEATIPLITNANWYEPDKMDGLLNRMKDKMVNYEPSQIKDLFEKARDPLKKYNQDTIEKELTDAIKSLEDLDADKVKDILRKAEVLPVEK